MIMKQSMRVYKVIIESGIINNFLLAYESDAVSLNILADIVVLICYVIRKQLANSNSMTDLKPYIRMSRVERVTIFLLKHKDTTKVVKREIMNTMKDLFTIENDRQGMKFRVSFMEKGLI